MDPLFLVGLGFTAAVTASLIALHAGRVVVPRVAEWERPPPVLVYSQGPVTITQVHGAVAKLEALGHCFGPVLYSDSVAVVPGAIVIGPVNQEQAKLNAIAAASWQTAFPDDDDSSGLANLDAPELRSEAKHVLGPVVEGRVTHAYIGLDALMLERRDPIRVLAHELAHALGYLHEETAVFGRKRDEDGMKGNARLGIIGRKTDHLMHPIYEHGGWGTKGLEAGALYEEHAFVRKHRGKA